MAGDYLEIKSKLHVERGGKGEEASQVPGYET